MTRISWTNETWNPVTGCHKVSEGCRHCYAETISLKNGFSKLEWTKPNAAQNVVLHPERLMKPKGVKKPTMWFVNSMSDMFHELVPDAFILQIWQVMEACPQHTFQILTKRPERMQAWALRYRPNPAKNVWLGTSVENEAAAIRRIPPLLSTRAAVRFISCEPLLGYLNLSEFLHEMIFIEGDWQRRDSAMVADEELYLIRPRVDWVIVGGESGPNFRPMDKDWATDILAQCRAANVPFFGKQDAAYYSETKLLINGQEIKEYPVMPEPETPPAVAGEQLSLF